MGYEHYWKRPPVLDADAFAAWADDVRKVVNALPSDMVCGPDGEGKPEITPTRVSFNGNSQQHAWRDAIGSSNINQYDACVTFDISQIVGGSYLWWSFADGRGWLNKACKTNGKPYDTAVTAALILLAHHFPDSCRVSSDGELADWQAGLEIAQVATGLRLHIPIYSHKLWYPDSLPRDMFRAWSADVQRVVETTDVQLAGPDGVGRAMVSPAMVTFNGVEEGGYDPFYISENHVPNDGRGHHFGWVYWEIQTMGNAGKRYDEVVIAALVLFAHHFFPAETPRFATKAYRIFSKGDDDAWQPGIDLVQRATGLRKLATVDEMNHDVTITDLTL